MQYILYGIFEHGKEQPFYIGKTIRGVGVRLREHLCHSRMGKTMKDVKIRKCLRENIPIEIREIARFNDLETLDQSEQEYIKRLGRRNDGTGVLTNHTNGGEGCVGTIVSPETRVKMSKAKIGNKINVGRKRPDVVERQAKQISIFDESGGWIGTYVSARECERRTGICFKKISQCLIGKNKSLIHDEILYQVRAGNDRDNIGAYNDISNHRHQKIKFRIAQIDPKTNQIISIYNSMREASQLTGIHSSSISQCCRGKNKTGGGFYWKLVPR